MGEIDEKDPTILDITTWLENYRERSKQFWINDKLTVIANRINRYRRESGNHHYTNNSEVKKAVLLFGKEHNIVNICEAAFKYDQDLRKKMEEGLII